MADIQYVPGGAYLLCDKGSKPGQLTAREKGVEVVECPESHRITGFSGGAADVRHQKSVGKGNEPRVDMRLVVERVDPGGPQSARRQRADERVIIDDGTASRVHEDRAPWQQVE